MSHSHGTRGQLNTSAARRRTKHSPPTTCLTPPTHPPQPTMKPEGFRSDTQAAISDYPDLISNSAVILAQDKIVPDVIEAISDAAAFKVTYGGRLVTPGAVLSINDVGAEPRVEITDCKASSVYALLMVDPDMPSPHKPEFKDVVIWMATNIQRSDFDSEQQKKDEHALAAVTADFVVEYGSPEPGKGTHRYAILLFEQPGLQTIPPPTRRAYFQTKEFAKQHGWRAVAGVYFKVKHGDA